MKDADYVKSVLQGDYATARDNELPYPDLDEVITSVEFNYLSGTVDGEVPNGEKSRDGYDYLWFKCGKKSILSHRFIVAVTIGKWPPRDFHVDHQNHNPSDNRPNNLRVVTPRDNAGNRRTALLSDLVDLEFVSSSIIDRKKAHELEAQMKAQKQKVEKEAISNPSPKPREFLTLNQQPRTPAEDPFENLRPTGSIPVVKYTGESKPGTHSGTYYKTNLESWHWY